LQQRVDDELNEVNISHTSHISDLWKDDHCITMSADSDVERSPEVLKPIKTVHFNDRLSPDYSEITEESISPAQHDVPLFERGEFKEHESFDVVKFNLETFPKERWAQDDNIVISPEKDESFIDHSDRSQDRFSNLSVEDDNFEEWLGKREKPSISITEKITSSHEEMTLLEIDQRFHTVISAENYREDQPKTAIHEKPFELRSSHDSSYTISSPNISKITVVKSHIKETQQDMTNVPKSVHVSKSPRIADSIREFDKVGTPSRSNHPTPWSVSRRPSLHCEERDSKRISSRRLRFEKSLEIFRNAQLRTDHLPTVS
jgi:hypothetical protein